MLRDLHYKTRIDKITSFKLLVAIVSLLLLAGSTAQAQLNVLLNTTDPTCNGISDGSITSTVTGATGELTFAWSTGATTAFIENLGEGTYSVTVTQAGGVSATASATLTEPELIEVTLGAENLCEEPFVVTANPTGGVSPYVYNWSTGAETQSVSVPAGSYCVTVVDANLCGRVECIDVAPDPVTVSVDTDEVTCPDAEDGTLTATPSSGSPPYTYAWSNGATTQTIDGLAPGTYTVTLTDAAECSATATGTVTSPPPIVLDLTPVSPNCGDNDSGSITSSVSGGTPGYTYAWSTGATSANISDLAPGSYSLTVTDANGCTAMASATIVAPPDLVIALDPQDVDCFGNTSGAIDATVTGGTPPYSYAWNNGATAEDLAGVGAGTYAVTVTDANGCTGTASTTINQPPQLTAAGEVTDVDCFGAATGAIDLTVSGGISPYNYNWSTGATTEDLADLSAGTYTVTVTDGNNCGLIRNYTVNEPDELMITADITPADCFEGATGAIDVTVTGGTAPYTFNWNTGATTEDLSGLMAGTYSLNVTDANDCISKVTITLTEPPAIELAATVTDVECFGLASGTIDLTVTGGTPPYSFNWSNGATTEDLTGLPAGNYTGTVTDANGCSASATLTVEQPTAISVAAESTDVDCFGAATGAINLIVSDGTPPYTFSWSNGATTEDLTGLTAGSYTGTVTDANGCMDEATVTINEPPAISVAAEVTDVDCNGAATGAIDVTVSGGTPPYTFSWNNGATTEDISDLSAGSYTGTITDANGCTASATVTVGEPPAISVSAAVTDVDCFGATTGAIDITVSGGTPPFTFSWSNGATTEDLAGLAAGSYTGTITDANGCTASATVTVDEPAAITISTQVTDVDCFGNSSGAIDLSVSGGTAPYTYTWSNDATTAGLSGVPAGTYVVTVTDANDCTATASATVLQPPQITIAGSVTDVDCFGAATGAIDLTVAGGTPPYAYNWSTGATTEDLTDLAAGTYAVTVTDDNNCGRVETYVVNEPPAITASATVTDVDCFGAATGAIDLTVSGGTPPYTFSWSNGATTEDLSGLSAGSYTGTITDANGCTASATVSVAEPPAISVAATVTDVDCFGAATGAIDLTVTGGTPPYTFSWSNGATTEDLTGLPAGDYTGEVTDANGCTATATVTVDQPTAISVSAESIDVECFGEATGAINLIVSDGTPPYTFQWSNGATTEDIDGLTAGNYTGTVTDANGCTASATVTITEPPALTIAATLTDVLCNGESTGSLNITVGGGTPPYTYSWSNGATTEDLTDVPAGTYTGTVTDANGCTITASGTVSEPPALQLSATITDVDCAGAASGAIDLTVTGGTAPYTFSWSNGATTEDLTGLAGGTYTGEVTDANGCTASATVTVEEPPAIEVAAEITDILCAGEETGAIDLTVSGGTPPYTYSWSNGATTEDLTGVPAGEYTGTITDANGCMASATATIAEPPALTIAATLTDVLCNGESTGSLDITVGGGTPPYTYSWSNGATTEDLTDVPAGTYTGTVTDANGCTITASGTISEPPALQLSATITDVDCAGADNGAIDLMVSGGTAPFTFSWSNGATTEDLTGLSGGTYTGEVTDANGCTASATVTVEEPPAIEVAAEITDILCNGEDTGAVDLTVSGGTPPYSFSWSNGATMEDLTDVPAGEYTGTVTDANGCTTSATVTIAEPPALTIAATLSDVRCNGESTGSLSITVGGGTPPYTYSWSNGATTEDLIDVPAGTYTGTVTDANGCTITASGTISEPPAINVSAAVTDVDCNGATTGAIDLTVSGGTAPFTFSWSNGATTEDLTGLSAGTYTGMVTDANGCTVSATVTVDEPTAISVAATVTDADCNGAATGSIDLTVSGGTPPYTFSWNNGATTEDLSGLAAGDYTGTVTDANGCMVSATVTVGEPSAINVSAAVTDADCNGAATGAIDLTVSGGTPPYTFSWSNGATTEDISGLAAGDYTGTVTDANGCTASATVTVGEAEGITVAITQSATCADETAGSATASATGGTPPYSFAWSTGATTATATDLAAGTYSVTVMDANGCTAADEVMIATFPVPTCVVEVLQESTLGDNGSVRVVASGGTAPFLYSWSNGATTETLTGLAPGTYSVTVTDANGCTTSCLATLEAFAGIGDYVWEDINSNGQQDATEPPIPGITVELKDAMNNVITTTTTDANGNYLFTGLTPGTYSVRFVIPDTLDYTVANTGDDATDSDVEPGMNGMTAQYVLAPGEINRTVDAGLVNPPDGAITDPCSCLNNATNNFDGQFSEILTVRSYPGQIWTIVDNGGMFSLDSPAPPAAPIPIPAGTVLPEVSPGVYEIEFRLVDSLVYFSEVSNGSFNLTISNQCFYPMVEFTQTPPDTLCVFDAAFAPEAMGSIPGEVVFSIDGMEIDVLDPAALEVGAYELIASLVPFDEDECIATISTSLTIIEECPAKIGDFVWLDEDFDGRQDANEPGIAGVNVTLTSEDGSYTDMTTTDADGMYMFSVDPGTYKVTFEQPADLIPTTPNVGTNDAIDSDVNPMTLMTGFVTVGPEEMNFTLDAGFRLECINIVDPGQIGYDQHLCGPGVDPDPIVDVVSATGGIGNVEYLWMFTTGDPTAPINFWTPIPNTNSPSYDPGPIDQTTYFIRCVRREFCDFYLESNYVKVSVGSQAVAIISDPGIICQGQEVTFSSADGSFGQWTFEGPVTPNVVNGSSVTVTYQNFGYFEVRFQVSNNNCTSTDVINVSVVNNPTTCVGSLGIDVGVTDFVTGAVSIGWEQDLDGIATTYTVERSFDGANFSAVGSLTEPSTLAGQTGIYEYIDITPKRGRNFYRVRAVDESGNEILSNTVSVSTEEAVDMRAKLFPNPAQSGTVNIELYQLPEESARITISNATGQVVHQVELTDPASPQPLNVSGLPAGLYFVRLQIDGEPAEVMKLMVE